jgi:phytanoyl-CoA hydroxylase
MSTKQLAVSAPDGSDVMVPIDAESDEEPSFGLADFESMRSYYRDKGYVLVRELIPAQLCERVRQTFQEEVKTYDGFLYRQPSSGAAERHKLTEHGFMLNSILNVQDLDRHKFSNFQDSALAVLTHENIHRVVSQLLEEEATIVQTMYFEGNPATWPHQDTYYLDSTELGKLVAGWFALEDIDAGAGRFFIYPESHKINLAEHGGDFDIAYHHDRYKQLVMDVIRERKLLLKAPALKAGDVLFWNSRTIHGSLTTTRPQFSRSSLTAHYVPSSTGLMQFQKRKMKLNLARVGPFRVHHPKDQARALNKFALQLESRFPRLYGSLKRLAIKLLTG